MEHKRCLVHIARKAAERDAPSSRFRPSAIAFPAIVDEVTTATGPSEQIDVVVAEQGIAINPKRQNLLDAIRGKGLPIRSIEEIKAEVEKICVGEPRKPRLGDRPMAIVKWVDGTVLDTVWQVLEDNPYAAKVAGGK